MKISARARDLKPSATLAITAKAKSLKAAGQDVLGFGAGEPDFDTPDHIKEAAKKALDEGFTKYTPAGGIDELKDAIISKYRRENGVEYDRENVIVCCGGKHAFYNLAQAVLDEGDEVVVPAPYWVSYPPMTSLADGVPVIVPTTEEEGFRMSVERLAAHVTDRTQAVVINSPSNPTGAAYSRDELAALVEFCLEKGIAVVSDEIYEHLTYDGFEFVSVASLSGAAKEGSVILGGVSKTYSMTGWRIGYALGPADVIKAMHKIQSQSTSNPTSIAQKAAVAALNGSQDFLGEWVEQFDKRRRFVVQGLNAIDGVSCFNPQGAFYVFPKMSSFYGKAAQGRTINGSVDLCSHLLETVGVALVPGEAFGADEHVRMSYATDMESLRKGLERIGEALSGLK